MHYDYEASKKYCTSIGLVWLGDNFILEADKDAFNAGFTQEQVDLAIRHYLWRVKYLFTPKNYSWVSRILIVVYFLTGWNVAK